MAEQRKRSWLWVWGLGVMLFGGWLGGLAMSNPAYRGEMFNAAVVDFIGFAIFAFAVARAIFRAIFRAAGQAFHEGAKGNH